MLQIILTSVVGWNKCKFINVSGNIWILGNVAIMNGWTAVFKKLVWKTFNKHLKNAVMNYAGLWEILNVRKWWKIANKWWNKWIYSKNKCH